MWRIDDADELEQTFAEGPTEAGTVRANGWFPGNLPTSTSKYVLCTGSKEWFFVDPITEEVEEWPALITAGELRNSTENLAFQETNNAADVRIIEAQSIMNPALVGSGAFQATVPALFLGNPAQPESMFAYIPGLVNMQVWNGQLWLPRPFGPRLVSVDIFETAVRNALGAGNVVFGDDWEWYHSALGEVYCGTNVIRVPPGEYWHWWDNVP